MGWANIGLNTKPRVPYSNPVWLLAWGYNWPSVASLLETLSERGYIGYTSTPSTVSNMNHLPGKNTTIEVSSILNWCFVTWLNLISRHLTSSCNLFHHQRLHIWGPFVGDTFLCKDGIDTRKTQDKSPLNHLIQHSILSRCSASSNRLGATGMNWKCCSWSSLLSSVILIVFYDFLLLL